MIGFLSGIVKLSKSTQVIVLVSGVGYLVNLPQHHNLKEGDPVELFIHTHVREDALTLYGFKDEAGLSLFEQLITVSGIGPKSALNILSAAPTPQVLKAIKASNLNFFTSVSGIGKKGAQKIILELKPKLEKGDVDLQNLEGNSDLNQALVQLGFHHNEIAAIVSSVDINQPLNQQIKQALQLLKS